MTVHEPQLDLSLADWEKNAERAELFEIEYCQSMRLRNFPDAGLGKDMLRHDRGHSVEQVVDYPVEHLDEEREALQDPAMNIVPESGAIRSSNDKAKKVSSFRRCCGSG